MYPGGQALSEIVNPILIFLACALGALGVVLAMPRRKLNALPVGAILAGAGAGVIMIALTLVALDRDQLPNIYFHIFAIVALGGALRMITHSRPVYAALYFILTIIATAGLFLILSAEFMAFAMIIIYAGAILITYLFVLMLATQAPVEEETDRLADYDASAREPILATIAGFAMLAILTTIVFGGAGALESRGPIRSDAELLAALPKKTESRLRDAGLLGETQSLQRVDERTGEFSDIGRLALVTDDEGQAAFLLDEASLAAAAEAAVVAVDVDADPAAEAVAVVMVPGPFVPVPSDVNPDNVERVGYNLLYDHPGAIEIAGIILLMAMIGAVVLSRRQIEIDEAEKQTQARAQAADQSARHLGDRPAKTSVGTEDLA
jgi:NADH-quinone oxidoreductase subunit J